ncbi:MAG: hypothetical protein ACOYN0_11365 [Phycisphaerales bacterium]
MKKVLVSLMVVAGMAVAANAQVSQRSQFEIELSKDRGVTWSNTMTFNPVTEAGPVFARVTVTYVANGGPTPLFFNGGRFQPTGAGWNQAGGDTALAINPTGRVVADLNANPPVLGRVFGATTVSAVIGHQYAFGGTNYLRFAETAATNHPGQGSGTNNVTGGAGINTSNNTLSPQLGISDLNLFVWGMNFTRQSGEISFSIPQEGFRTSGATANPANTRSATWVTNTSPFTTVEAPTLDTIGATLTFVPAPSAAALLGLGGLVVGRRRR